MVFIIDFEISIPLAKDDKGKLVHIKSIKQENRKLPYFCPCCDSVVKPRAINDNNKVQPHFYHVDKSNCRQESIYQIRRKTPSFSYGDIRRKLKSF